MHRVGKGNVMGKKNPYPNCPERVSKPIRMENGGYCEMNIEIGKWMKPNFSVLGIQFLLENNVVIVTGKLETISLMGEIIKYWNPDSQKVSRISLEQAALKILSSDKVMFKK